jgi:hypothetical protein
MRELKKSKPTDWVRAFYRIVKARAIICFRFKTGNPIRGEFEWKNGHKKSIKFAPNPDGIYLVYNVNTDENFRISIDIRKQYPLTFRECFPGKLKQKE